MIVSDTYRYVFVEVPRTGSSAVSRELRAHYEGRRVLRKHATYRDYVRRAADEQRTYFSFMGVRNPLDVAVSRFAALKSDPQGRSRGVADRAAASLAERLERRVHAWVQSNDADFERFLLRWYVLPYDNWASLEREHVDMVLRFESLHTDFTAVLERIGAQRGRPLPIVNPTPGRQRDYVSSYTPRAIRRAAWVFGPYMQEWGYSFPESWGSVKVPLWSKVLMRALRTFRGIYWKHLRFADYTKKRPGGITSPRDLAS
jgi:hypothetical protein